MNATGTFTVQLQPLNTALEFSAPANAAALSIAKQFSGDLQAQSTGEMHSVRIDGTASAGYVALEQVTGTLSGRTGSFVLQHFGLMQGESSELILKVVPDSATDELLGLSGDMTIRIDQGVHHYAFDYQLRGDA